MQCNFTKFSRPLLLLLMNIIIDVTNLISGFCTNLRSFSCKKCDVGYYVVNHDVYTKKIVLLASVYCLNFIITQNS